MVAQTAEQEGSAQHEEGIRHDRARDTGLDQGILSGLQSGNGNNQFRQVSQGRVEKATDRVSGLCRDGFGGVAEKDRERENGKDRKNEMEGMCLMVSASR